MSIRLGKDAYTYCPDCHRKGVTYRFRSNGEDNRKCRYCDWYYFTLDPMDRQDRENEKRYEEEQAKHDQV